MQTCCATRAFTLCVCDKPCRCAEPSDSLCVGNLRNGLNPHPVIAQLWSPDEFADHQWGSYIPPGELFNSITCDECALLLFSDLAEENHD